MTIGRRGALLLPLAFAGCARFGARRAGGGQPRYLVGAPYQEGGTWRYPREDFTLVETGLGVVAGTHPAFTANGELFDQTAMAAAHPTLQLPCVARVTNLDTGREVLVRINDRGPAAPGRVLQVTRRVAELLGAAPQSIFRMRLEVQEEPSRALAAALEEPATVPVLTAAALPVEAHPLAPPPGARQASRVREAALAPVAKVTAAPVRATVPLRLPESVRQGTPRPGVLFIDCGAFGRLEYASMLQARLARLGAHLDTSYGARRDRAYRVRIGPLPGIAAADAMLERALHEAVPDARIIVD
jgi:rare lipoprotein A